MSLSSQILRSTKHCADYNGAGRRDRRIGKPGVWTKTMMLFIFLVIGLAAMLVSGSGPTLIKKESEDRNLSRDNWAAKWRAWIDEMDVNGDGELDENEYVNMTAARVGAMTNSNEKEDKIKAYLQENWDTWWKNIMDDENLKSFSTDDFLSKETEIKSKMAAKHYLQIAAGWYLTFFEVVDANEDGSLDKDEYVHFLKIFRAQFSPEILAEVDTNGNGVISKGEMVTNGLSFTASNNLAGLDLFGEIFKSST